ncbi:serine/threonine protein kinase [Streptomyces griseoflavus Tu4000]|uniref:Serine/threonine protein kinase n=1 Tax=Streptomyces griseoflavus Tu4000 TaxID=467200 RepID=D9XV99_9ACTN|nr:serine/threonine protein kinase [Streptomyces griseoflavus Tu4000]
MAAGSERKPPRPAPSPAAAQKNSNSGTASPAAPATEPTTASGPGAPGPGQRNAAAGGRSSGWPVMTPPDLPARPVPRAPLTDVVPRRTLIIIAVVVALAVLGTVLALTLGDDGGGAGAKGGGDRTTAGSTPSADTRSDDSDGTRTDGTATDPAGTATGSGPASDGAGAGAGDKDDSAGDEDEDDGGTSAKATHKGKQGYSIGLPDGWKFQSSGSAGDRFTGPDGQKLLIGWTTTPKDDPVADWQNQERYMVRSQYKRIRIEAVEYRGWNTADWEFTYVEGGTTYRSVDRGTVVGDRLGYGLMYTAKAGEWDSDLREDTWRTLTKTFKPKS